MSASGGDGVVDLVFKLLWGLFYLFVWGPCVAWPRAIWRSLYPALKQTNLDRLIWAPAILIVSWIALCMYFDRLPQHGVALFGIERGLRRIWNELNTAAITSYGLFFDTVNAKALASITWGWLPPLVMMTQTFVASTLVAAPLHVLGLYLFPGGSQDKGSHGSALWGGGEDAQRAGNLIPKGYVGGLMLGRLQKAPPKKYDERLRVWRHVLTCAPTGAGKGVGCVVPNLLDYPGSVVCLDVKGENYAITARAREAMGQAVYCFDPFGITGASAHRLNWLDAIRLGDEECVSDAASLAETLVLRRSGDGDSHWDDAAAHLLQGLLLHVAGLENTWRHPGTLRRLLTLSEPELTSYLEGLTKNAEDGAQGAWGMPARAANAFLSKADRERSGVLSTAQRHTAFLDDPRVVRSLSASDIDLRGLKARPMTVYIVMPPDKLAAYGRVARACIGLAIKALMHVPGKPQDDVLFLLDEFAQLGRFGAVEDGLAILRGYGGVFWLLVQDLSQLRAVYPRAETFLANTVLQAFGTQDYHTASYLSQMLGSETIQVESHGTSENNSWERSSRGTSQNLSLRGRELLTPDEIRRMDSGRVLVFEQGQPPHLLCRLDYRSDHESRGRADVNPMHAPVSRTG